MKHRSKKYVQLILSPDEHIALKLIADKFEISLTKLLRESIMLWIMDKRNSNNIKNHQNY